MEFDGDILRFGSFFAVTLDIMVLFVGKRLNDAVGVLTATQVKKANP